MKKILAISLAILILMFAFAGCANANNNQNDANNNEVTDNNLNNTNNNNSSDNQAEDDKNSENTQNSNNSDKENGNTEEKGEPEKVIMTYIYTGTLSPEIDKVQEEINKLAIAEKNVEVELKPVTFGEVFGGSYSLWISSGEQVDLMCIPFMNIASYVNSGQLEPIGDLIESVSSTIDELRQQYPIESGAIINNSLYGVRPVNAFYGTQGGMIFNKDIFEETDVEYVSQYEKVYSVDEITNVLGQIKENHPDSYPVSILGSGITKDQTSSGTFIEFDTLGATIQSGVLMGHESEEIINLFETDEYLEVLKTRREWYEDGFIPPDAATTDALSQELLQTGVCHSYLINLEPIMTTGTLQEFGWESYGLATTEGYYGSLSPTNGVYWTVPITSANPEAAMKFLDLTYSSKEVVNLFMFGIEGEHHVKKEDSQGTVHIEFPEGKGPGNIGYYNQFGLYGNRRFEMYWNQGLTQEECDKFTNNNRERTYKSVGYAYDSTEMQNQIIAIGTVLEQYMPSLETGSIEEYEDTYYDMLEGLNAAGIDDVIADNQAQFDAWLSEQ